VRPDRHDSVVADGARPVRSHSDSDTPDFRTATLTRLRLALSPLESLGATVERLFHECAGDVGTLAVGSARPDGRPEWRFACGCVDLVDFDLVESQLLRGLREHGLDNPVALHRSRRPLLHFRESVREDTHTAPAHRQRLIHQRSRVAGAGIIIPASVRTVVLHNEQVHGRDAAVLAESDFDPARHIRPDAADIVLLLPADPHHHRRIHFLGQYSGDGHRYGSPTLTTETAAGVLRDKYDVRCRNAEPLR